MGGPLTRRPVLAGTAVLVLAAALAGPAAGGSAQVTRGDFHAFADGTGLDISGHAQMVRTADGRTFVSVHVEGLLPGTYGAHVHKQACGNGNADGHYQFSATGGVNDVNEIWPGFTTNAAGIGNGRAMNAGTAGTAAVSVVVHAPTTNLKIACADLE
jgi:Cu/Zn superoxide dismutase